MRRFIVTKQQLVEYVEKKKSEKTFYDMVEHMHKNMKYLNENVSHKNANQSIINDYKRKNLITPKVFEMLVKNKIMNENYEIL
jgi:hypothetical protein